MAAIVVFAGPIWNVRVAAGSDVYGYVSQVDLWLRGNLRIDQTFATAAGAGLRSGRVFGRTMTESR